MPAYTTPLSDLARESLTQVGGKAANLAELGRAGIAVPAGFCLTTAAFRRFLESSPQTAKFYDQLEQLAADDPPTVARVGAGLRDHLQALPMPDDVREALLAAWRAAGTNRPYAVRSSATAEDLPGASFAGQHDTYLNISSSATLLDRVQRCWVSLFTDRAIVYRARHGFDHRRVELAVIVQAMVQPQVSGVMFTADPVTGNRHAIVINASYGLGEAVVSGLVNPDLYRVGKDGTLHRTVADKRLMVTPRAAGGVSRQEVPEADRKRPALPDDRIEELARLGRRIQDHFGAPQDIEWALADGRITVLQSRPITSLYPTPAAPADDRLHVYFSFGHQQMMTDAMKPLARSVLRTYFPFGRRLSSGESTQLVPAGGRLFFDYTDPLHTRLGRRMLARAAGAMDRRVGEAILDIAEWPEFRARHQFRPGRTVAINLFILRTLARMAFDLCLTNVDTKLARTDGFLERMLARSRADIDSCRGVQRIERIQRDLMTFPMQMFFRVNLTQLTAITARGLIEGLCRRWLAAPMNLAALHKSLPGNVTTEMGLAIGDLADLVRDRPELRALLQSPPEPFTLAALDAVPDGPEFRTAFSAFLDRYGVRGTGEVDLTRVRWGEQPTQLFSGILANVRTGQPGEHRERFLAGEREAQQAIASLLSAIRAVRWGRPKAAVMSRLVRVYRTMLGLREHPKFQSVRQFDIYRRAIRAEAAGLVEAGVLTAVTDADYLSLHELRELLAGGRPAGLAELIETRKTEHAAQQSLSPPRLFTSDGEIVTGARAGHHKPGVLVGCPVSAGIAEGRARVVLRPQDAHLQEGDILVAPSTDPAWTPLFSAVRGIVLEIGGVMSHGAVVARELGLPTVVGIDNATELIGDGERIRVDGSEGLVEPLPDPGRSHRGEGDRRRHPGGPGGGVGAGDGTDQHGGHRGAAEHP